MKSKIIFITGSLFLAACGGEVEPKSLVHDLTIIGVRAQPPEIAPGASTMLDALVGDPNGAGRPVELSWYLCQIDPAVGTASCEDETRLTPIGAGLTLDLTVPADALASIPAEQRARGIDVFVALKAEAGGEVASIAIKRVRVSENTAKNTNPTLEEFEVDGVVTVGSSGAFVVQAESEVELYARATEASHDEYIDDIGAPAIEEMKFAWFLTAGALEREVTWEEDDGSARVKWTAPSASETEATLWVVLRDGRGGADWRTLRVEAVE